MQQMQQKIFLHPKFIVHAKNLFYCQNSNGCPCYEVFRPDSQNKAIRKRNIGNESKQKMERNHWNQLPLKENMNHSTKLMVKEVDIKEKDDRRFIGDNKDKRNWNLHNTIVDI